MMMNEAQIKHMVDRFLAWPLPNDFNPDGEGLSFTGFRASGLVGTNLFTATQAEAMVRYMLVGSEVRRIETAISDPNGELRSLFQDAQADDFYEGTFGEWLAQRQAEVKTEMLRALYALTAAARNIDGDAYFDTAPSKAALAQLREALKKGDAAADAAEVIGFGEQDDDDEEAAS
jgi:hypothetical protein